MRSPTIVAVIAVLALVVLAADASNDAPLTGKLRSQQNMKMLAEARAAGKVKRLRMPVKKAGISDDDQPKRMIIMISNFCQQELYYDEWSSDMSAGGYKVAPAPYIPPTASETFVAVPNPGSVDVKGQVVYWFDSGAVQIWFSEEKGEWMLEVEYQTIADIALVGDVPIAKSAFYNIISGKNAYNGTSMC